MRLFTIRALPLRFVGAVLFALPVLPALANEEAAAGKSKVFPPFDTTHLASTLFWLALLFGLLYWLMSRHALPRIAGIKQARREQVERDLSSAAAMQKKAEEAEAAYTAALAKSKSEAQISAQAARDAANAEAEKRRAVVEAELAAKMQAAESQIASAKSAAMSNVSAIARDAASEIVRQITGQAPAAADLTSAIAAAAKA
jgi:F-type H+-transporting ATPase subunit b